ncbi:NAD(P)-dependent oxidoreductase [Mycoplasmoides pirum]|uniref:NAD(P)-dependent oxidoreductase n=1 Tax=Mycoplasmoides pirum TaxID=2122 RepID=UPI000482B0DB|nr:NAD(P)H-binding protein [Mycoplasmoides pirum]
MNIAIIGANGKIGKMLVNEAIKQKMDVTAISRKVNSSNANKWMDKDVFELNNNDLKEFDVIIDALAFWTPETFHLHSESIEHLSNLLADTKKRLIIVGGAGSLFISKSKNVKLMDSLEFPSEYIPVAKAMNDSFELLKTKKDVWWTYVSPPLNFSYDGLWTGSYKIGGDVMIKNHNNESYISYIDYAIAIIDEITKGNHLQEHISVVGA